MNQFRRLRASIIFLILLYCFASQFLVAQRKWEDVIPLASWNLFSTPNQEYSFYRLKIEKVPGLESNALPCFLENCPELFSVLRQKRLFFSLQYLSVELAMIAPESVELFPPLLLFKERLYATLRFPVTFSIHKTQAHVGRFLESSEAISEEQIYYGSTQ